MEANISIDEVPIRRKRKQIVWKNESDRLKYESLSSTERKIFLAFFLYNNLQDGHGNIFFMTKKQKLIIKKILIALIKNAKVSYKKLIPLVIESVYEEIKIISKKYNNLASKILESEDYWILDTGFGKEPRLFRPIPDKIKEMVSRLRPRFLKECQWRNFNKGRYQRGTKIELTPFGIFMAKLLSKDSIENEEEIQSKV